MGQASKRSSKRSTSGWDEQWKDYIRKKAPIKKGHAIWEERKEEEHLVLI